MATSDPSLSLSLPPPLQASSPSNSWLVPSNAYISIAETTMADPAPTERPVPVGCRFHPTDQELVGHYLRRKLMADDPSIHETVPEICVCKYEPQDLLARAASSVSTIKLDDFQCYFFSPRDYKDSKGKRLNRTTSRGFWKVTGEDGIVTDGDTNNVIGKKKRLVYYEGRGRHARNTNWVIYEYYDDQLPPQQNTHVLYRLKKKDGKKVKGKTHKVVTNKRKLTSEVVNQTNTCVNSNNSYPSNMNLMIHPSSQSNEATDSMIQPPSPSSEVTGLMIQLPSPSSEATDLMIQQPSLSSEATDSMIQPSFQLNEATDSMIQSPSQPNEAMDSIFQQISEVDEWMNSIIQTPPEANFVEETFDEEFYFSLFGSGEFDLASPEQLPPASWSDEQGLFESMATSDMHWHEA